MYWAQTVPYLVDVSNSIIVSISWMILGNNTLGKHMSPFMLGLLIFAMSGAELAAPYVTRLKNPRKEFPKSMWMLFAMTVFMTLTETLGLAVLFDAKHIPHDFKMNGAFYAFQLLGEEAGMGKSLMYMYAIVCLLNFMADLAALIDAASRVFASDTSEKYMPSWLRKKNKDGLPVNSYVLTCGITLFLLLLSGTLPEINDIFNWLLNLNGIVSPYKTSVVFLAFLAFRYRHKTFAKDDFVFIRNNKGALAVGWWCFIFTFICATMGFLPQDVTFESPQWTKQLWMNIITVIVLFGTGFLLPWLRKLELKHQAKANS